MRKLLFLMIVLVYFASCDEVPPEIRYNNKPVDTTLVDTSYIATTSEIPQQKKVLIEDFTGVRCPNCPKAAKRIHELDSAYPGKIVAMGVHLYDNPFGTPHDDGVDYRTHKGTDIFEMLGKGGLPIGDVDRFIFSGETSELVREDKWETYMLQRLNETVPVNIYLEDSIYEDTARYLIVKVKLHFHQALSDNYFLTLALTENKMISKQTMPDNSINANYEHNHVLRHIFTFFSGDQLDETLVKNRVFIKEYKVLIDEKNTGWEQNNLNVVAFVHRGITSNEVVQASEIHLQ